MFILGSSALLQLFAEDYADLVSELRAALKARLTGEAGALYDFYAGIEPIEFLEGRARSAGRSTAGDSGALCGWTNSGSSQRLETTLRTSTLGLFVLMPSLSALGVRGAAALEQTTPQWSRPKTKRPRISDDRALMAHMSDGDSRLIPQLKRGNLAIGRGSGV